MIRPTPKKKAVCNNCTIKLIRICYERKWWFRLIREPMALGMRILCWFHGIDPRNYEVRSPECYGCMRFRKTALKEHSTLFRWLNDRINPIFDRIKAGIVSTEEATDARETASQLTHPPSDDKE